MILSSLLPDEEEFVVSFPGAYVVVVFVSLSDELELVSFDAKTKSEEEDG